MKTPTFSSGTSFVGSLIGRASRPEEGYTYFD
jgi:hypothetical protein